MRRTGIWFLQISLVALVAWFVWRSVARDAGAFRALSSSIHLRPGWILASAVSVWAGYAVLIGAWRTIVAGWDRPLGFPVAARIWCLSNLGRYLPGKVWSVAGLAVLAQRKGISGWAAGGSAIVMQTVSLATGALVAAGVLADAAFASTRIAVGVLAIGLAAGIVTLLASSSRAFRSVARLAGRDFPAVTLPRAAVVRGTLATLAAWVIYGLAFYLLARGTVPAGATVPSLARSITTFSAGYIVGLVAVLVPGGLGVREGVLVALLTPTTGGPVAVVLAVAARLLFTMTELTAALAALLWSGTKETRLGAT